VDIVYSLLIPSIHSSILLSGSGARSLEYFSVAFTSQPKNRSTVNANSRVAARMADSY